MSLITKCKQGLARAKFALFGAMVSMVAGSALAEDAGGSSSAFDLTDVGTEISNISDSIVTFVKGTVLGKVIAVAAVYVVIRLAKRIIAWFASR